jgi:hypothetical protein
MAGVEGRTGRPRTGASLMFGWLLGDEPDRGDASTVVPTGPQLSIISVSEDFLALHNGGTTLAERVLVDRDRSSIDIVNRADEPFDLAPGESWTFLIEGLGPWTEDGWQITLTLAGQDKPVCVPLGAAAF